MKSLFRILLIPLLTIILYTGQAQVADTLGPKVYTFKGDYYNPPYEFINAQGEPDGFLVELFYALAAETGIDFTLELDVWAQVRHELESGQTDAVIGMMYSADRAKKVHFSIPHSLRVHRLYTHRESQISTLEDLVDKEVIVREDGRMHDYLIESGMTTKIIPVQTQHDALVLLNSGRHDAALLGYFQGTYLMSQHDFPNVVQRASGIQPQRLAYAVSWNNEELLALIDSGLLQLQANGEYDRLYDKWFGFYEREDFFERNYQWIIGIGILILLLILFIVLLRYQVFRVTRHLKQSEARYRSIFRNQHTVMLLIDPATGNIVDANPAAEKFYGFSTDQLTSMNISQINPLSLEELREEMQKARRENRNLFRFRHRLANGEERLVEVHSGAIVQGKKELLYSIIHDITQREKAQEENRNWQKLLQNIITNAPNSIVVTDDSLRYIYVSDSVLKNYNISQSEILGKSVREVLPDQAAKWEAVIQRALQGEVIRAEEDIIDRGPQGQEAIRWECHPWYHADGVIAGTIIYSEVITERKKAEELRYNLELARKTSQIKQAFLANVSHEMRTPLNGIIGLSNHLATTPLTQEQSNYLNIIIDSSQTLLQLINQVLNLSKLESEQDALTYEEIKVNDIIKKLHDSFSFLFNEKGIAFEIEVAEDFPPTITYNEHLLMQVLTNLTGNALKFTTQGKVKVSFQIRKMEGDQELLISVTDTGPGIPEEHHENIFQEFVQVHDSEQYHQPGSGLGLPISKKIVESFGGRIGLESTPGKGSRFWFTIIHKEINLPQPEEIEIPPVKVPLHLSVLLVEDKKVNRMVAELILKEMGCSTEHAENGLIAIEKVKQKTFDVILMDIQMPVMDGITAMQTLHSMGVGIPIVGLSAQAMEGDAERFISMGMNDYVTKPIDANILYQKLKNLSQPAS